MVIKPYGFALWENMRDLLEIGLYFIAADEVGGPFGVGCEFIGVSMRRDVACESRVTIVAPGPADTIGLFINGDMLVTGFFQLDRAKDAGHSGTDYCEALFCGVHSSLLKAHSG